MSLVVMTGRAARKSIGWGDVVSVHAGTPRSALERRFSLADDQDSDGIFIQRRPAREPSPV